MPSNIQLALRTLNVPDDLPHRARSLEIEELVDYLEVDMETSAGLSLVNYGSGTPPVDTSHLPWVRLNADGSPAGLYVNHRGEWVSAIPRTVQADLANLRMMTGSCELTFDASADTLQTSDVIEEFDPVFDEAPIVMLTPTGGTLLADPDNAYQYSLRVDSRIDKFYIEYRSHVNNSGSAKLLTLDWVVIGVRE